MTAILRPGGLRRRDLLRTAAAGTGLVLASRLGLSAAHGQDRPYEGESLNLLIIQPHVLTGEKLAEDFEAATGARVNVTAVPYDQVQTTATLDVQSGANEFDVLDYWYTTKGQLADDGVLEDVTDWIERDAAEIEPDDYIENIYDTYTLHEGRRWGLPYDGDAHLLFYNAELLERHGLEPPTTWDDYALAVRTITEAEAGNGIYGAAVLGGRAPVIIGSSFANRLAGFGGSFLNADGSSALDGDAALEAARSLLDVAPHALPTPLETRFEEGLPAFLGGQVAFIEFWSDLGVYAQDPDGSQIVDRWGAVRIPVGGANTAPRLALNAGFAFGVSTGSRKKELAWELIKFATNAAYQEELLLITGSGIDPSRTSALYSERYAEFAPIVQGALAGGIEEALPWPTTSAAPRLQQSLADELALVLAGSKTPEQALGDAHAAWNEAISA